jgi:hypothetical protein
MGKTYDQLDEKLTDFIGRQKMFFVATAPLSAEGHVNLSPKGYDALRVLGPRKVAYADLGGSGIETVAHIRENGRLTLMFCAFEGPAMILRLQGKGRVLQFDEPGFAQEMERFGDQGRVRNIVYLDIERIADSCGWGVPFYDFKEPREQLKRAIAHLPESDLHAKWRAGNAESIDGLPGLKPVRD